MESSHFESPIDIHTDWITIVFDHDLIHITIDLDVRPMPRTVVIIAHGPPIDPN
jgi:hypothetical protein